MVTFECYMHQSGDENWQEEHTLSYTSENKEVVRILKTYVPVLTLLALGGLQQIWVVLHYSRD